MKKYDICIIGAGASGIAAALAAAEQNAKKKIALIEKNGSIGRKLAATGNGRCNITNAAAKGNRTVSGFLAARGIILRKEDEGRIYPYSGRASQVVRIFENEMKYRRIDIMTGKAVLKVCKKEGAFYIDLTGGETINSEKLIIACGGKAAPQYGTTGDGYRMVKDLGHTVTKLAPALAPLELDEDIYDWQKVKGARAKGTVRLFRKGKLLIEETGEIQFTDKGISGIAVFNCSRYVKLMPGESMVDIKNNYVIKIDLMPEYTLDEARAETYNIKCRHKKDDPLITIVDDRIADMIYTLYGKEDPCKGLKDLTFRVRCVAGWKQAQVTSGGVPLCELDEDTGSSKITEGLYITGEMTDYDGRCGGYNLDHALLSGIRAGKSAASDENDPQQ